MTRVCPVCAQDMLELVRCGEVTRAPLEPVLRCQVCDLQASPAAISILEANRAELGRLRAAQAGTTIDSFNAALSELAGDLREHARAAEGRSATAGNDFELGSEHLYRGKAVAFRGAAKLVEQLAAERKA